uniref:Uncharacterized protein n=1 Tax=Leersia perrieri TaxID=77586 RepID=A0A0D9V077_9ORYZ
MQSHIPKPNTTRFDAVQLGRACVPLLPPTPRSLAPTPPTAPTTLACIYTHPQVASYRPPKSNVRPKNTRPHTHATFPLFPLHFHLQAKSTEDSSLQPMCGGAIIYDYIPARRRVCASDFWPDADADDSDPHAPAPEKHGGGGAACSVEVKELSEELEMYENYMNFLGIPYMEGGAPASGAGGEEGAAPAGLWAFDDYEMPSLGL